MLRAFIRTVARGASSVTTSPRAAALGCGVLCGVYLVSCWQVYLGTYGISQPFAIGAMLVTAAALSLGLSARHKASTAESGWLYFALAAWTVALPWLAPLPLLAADLAPLSLTARPAAQFAIGLLAAGLCLGLPMLLAGRLLSVVRQGGRSSAIGGVAAGVALTALTFAPLAGLQPVALVAALIGGAVFLWKMFASGRTRVEIEAPAIETPGAADRFSAGRRRSQHAPAAELVAAAIAGAVFLLFCRMLEQLMPAVAAVGCVGWAGLLAGVCLARILNRSPVAPYASTSLVLLAVWPAVVVSAFPLLVDGSLWMNSHISEAWHLLALRGVLIVAVASPIGFAAALGPLRRNAGSLPGIIPAFAVGWVAARLLLLPTIGPGIALAGLCVGAFVIAVSVRLSVRPLRMTWGARAAVCAAGLCAVAAPWWRVAYDPGQSAKLLFATNVFLAQRAGLDRTLLMSLDESRLLGTVDGDYSTTTVWKQRGSQIQTRASGVPKAVVSTNPATCPHYPPEIMQAVLPLVLHERPASVLILGLGGGNALTTCLSFPVQQLTCVEPDAGIVRVFRRLVAPAGGIDPLEDDRIELLQMPLTLALAADDRPYDVIISGPEQSALLHAAPEYTVEFYRAAARRLSGEGIFCQRFQAVDYGPRPLASVVRALQRVFREVIAFETGAGEFMLVAANTAQGLVRPDLLARLSSPHVRKAAAEAGWDWSLLLNLPAYSHAELQAFAENSDGHVNTAANGLFAFSLPSELLRWGPKMQETRTALAPRQSRLLAWIGEDGERQEVLRRLGEVAAHSKLIHEHPDTFWWEYRKTAREQIETRPRSLVRQVSATTGARGFHPEDRHRMAYFAALGKALKQRHPSPDSIQNVERFEAPYDPLISLFLHQEVAELYGRSEERDLPAELAHRLHVIYFSTGYDVSVRNVVSAIELLIDHPEAVPDPLERWDHLNALLQMLRQRWELRGSRTPNSARVALNDVEQCLLALERAFAAMETLTPAAGLPREAWDARRQVLERTAVRPLRTYRVQLMPHDDRNRLKKTLADQSQRTAG